MTTPSTPAPQATAGQSPLTPQALIGRLVEGKNLADAEMQGAMNGIMDGQWTPPKSPVF